MFPSPRVIVAVISIASGGAAALSALFALLRDWRRRRRAELDATVRLRNRLLALADEQSSGVASVALAYALRTVVARSTGDAQSCDAMLLGFFLKAHDHESRMEIVEEALLTAALVRGEDPSFPLPGMAENQANHPL